MPLITATEFVGKLGEDPLIIRVRTGRKPSLIEPGVYEKTEELRAPNEMPAAFQFIERLKVKLEKAGVKGEELNAMIIKLIDLKQEVESKSRMVNLVELQQKLNKILGPELSKVELKRTSFSINPAGDADQTKADPFAHEDKDHSQYFKPAKADGRQHDLKGESNDDKEMDTRYFRPGSGEK